MPIIIIVVIGIGTTIKEDIIVMNKGTMMIGGMIGEMIGGIMEKRGTTISRDSNILFF